MKKKLFLAALVALTLIGCETRQSELVLDGQNVEIATITGKVTWSPDGQQKAADSVAIRAVVANAQYSAGATGSKQFEPVFTDKNGFYSLRVPVGQVTINGVRVEVVPFQGKYTDPNTGVSQTVYYTSDQLPAAGLSLKAGEVKNVDIEVKPELTFKDYTSSVKISGIVTYDAGINAVSYGYEKAYKPYANSVLKVQGTYLVDGNPVDRDMEDVTTNENGEYSFEVPAGDNAAAVTLTTVRFDGEYTKEVNGEYKTTTVYYQVAQHVVNFTALDVEKRNENFTVMGHDEAPDLTKDYNIKKISAIVKTLGEVKDEELAGDETWEKYKMDDVFLPFNVRVTLSCPNYDATHATSPLAGNELIFTVTPSTKDGSIVLNDTKVYSVWEGYPIRVKITVEDLLQPMTHTYYEFSGFDKATYKTKTWAQWHKDEDTSEPLSSAFWSRCWPSTQKIQNIEGYYHLAAAVTEDIPANTLHYYSEYTFTNDVVLTFNPREPKTIKGYWDNPDYNTRNEKDEFGNYTDLSVPDDAVDKDDIALITRPVAYKVLHHNKYQGVCRDYWAARYPALW